MKRALITGGAGFVGRNLSRHLQENDWDVLSVDIRNQLDCIDYFDHSIARFDLVVHAAAAGPHRKAIDTQPRNFPYNVMLDAAAIDWAMRTRQGHFVYLSSAAVYDSSACGYGSFIETKGHVGDPFDHYGATKRVGEKMIEASRLPYTIVRPFSGYGSDQSIEFPFGAFVDRARRREHPFHIWGSGEQVRDFIHIDDICRAIITLATENILGPVNLCTGIGITLKKLAYLCLKQVDYNPQIHLDRSESEGVDFRVGDPTYLNYFYTPKITIEEGVRRALEE